VIGCFTLGRFIKVAVFACTFPCKKNQNRRLGTERAKISFSCILRSEWRVRIG